MNLSDSSFSFGAIAYSNFGIGVDRKNAAKWRFPQENGTFRCSQEVYVYSEIALANDADGHNTVEEKLKLLAAYKSSLYLQKAMDGVAEVSLGRSEGKANVERLK